MLQANEILPAFGYNKVEHDYSDLSVGFPSGRHVWHWFFLCKDGTMIFNHSYSQNTGRTKKGYNQGLIAERSALKLAAPLCPDCESKVHFRGTCYTAWYGNLTYYRCHKCETTFVSQNENELAIAAKPY